MQSFRNSWELTVMEVAHNQLKDQLRDQPNNQHHNQHNGLRNHLGVSFTLCYSLKIESGFIWLSWHFTKYLLC